MSDSDEAVLKASRQLLLGIDTCGVTGSVALGRIDESDSIELLGEAVLGGGEYASTLLTTIADLLDEMGTSIAELAGIVVVAGPGSFTGIRIGLAAVKALSEVAEVPVVAVSRLALLVAVANGVGERVGSVVLDAHRGQFYCGWYAENEPLQEALLTAGEINSMGGLPQPVAVCEEAVAQTLEMLMEIEVLRVPAATAADALRFGLAVWRAREFADVAALDGYYLRGADAKISGR